MGAWIETSPVFLSVLNDSVAPFVGAWIETEYVFEEDNLLIVAPFVGAWIETYNHEDGWYGEMSLPSWERGLKRYQMKL